MTIHHMQFLDREQISLRWTDGDDCSTSSMDAEITTTTPLKQKPSPVVANTRKSVRFSDEDEYFEVDHVDDLDEEEIANAWYSKRDYSMIRATYSVTVRIMMTARCLDNSEEHCPRGLEYRTPEGSQKRQSNKWTAIEAVLDEQHRQREANVEDDECLAQIYRDTASHCQQEALERGLADAEAVAKLAKETATPNKRSPRRSFLVKNPSARRRAVLEDLHQMISGTNIVRSS